MKNIKSWIKVNCKTALISIILIVIAIIIPDTIQFSVLMKLISGYLGIFILTAIFPKYKFFEYLKLLIGLPYLLMIAISPIHLATMSIFFTLIFSFGIPAMLILLIGEISSITLTRNSIYYLGLTIGSFIFLLFGNWMIKKNIEIIESDKPKKRTENQVNLTLNFLNQNTYRIIIYSIFLVLLFATSLYDFQNSMYKESIQWTKPILQSFVTIVAFERVILKTKQFKVSLKEMKENFLEIYKTY